MNKKEKDFSTLVNLNKATIYSVCYMFSKDSDETDDLFQEVLMKLWRGYNSFKGDSNIKTWIYRVSLNTCINIDRKKRRHAVKTAMGVDLFDDIDANNRQTKILHDRISRLKPFDRAIVLLWLEDISYEEIGEIVGISAKNVSVRLYRIKEELKKMSNSDKD